VNLSHSYSRDPRLDFFRGLALLCIFVDHAPGDRLTDYTIRNLGFSDASELFVFISAYAAGLVYTTRERREGLAAVSRRILQRVLQIYSSHIVLLVIVCVLAGWLTRVLRDPQFVQGLNVGPFLANPQEVFLQALALTFQPTFMNILPLYVVLLAFLPLMLWLIRRSALLAFGLSFGLYVAAREWPEYVHGPFGPIWQFNPLAWQLLFVIGATLGAFASQGHPPVPRSRVLWVLAATYAVAAFWIGPAAWTYDGSTIVLPGALHSILFPVMERANLSLWRLAHILALTYLVTWFLPSNSVLFRWRGSQPLILMGQHSLPLFCIGVLLSIAGWVALARLGGTLALQIAVNVGGFAIMVAVAWLLSLRTRPSRVAATPAEPDAVRRPA